MSIIHEDEPSARSAPRPVLDVTHLSRQTFGDRELEQEVLALFDEQCIRLAPIIAGDRAAAERSAAAHTLKGAARGVGAWRLAAAAELLETALTRGDDGRAMPERLAELAVAIAETRAAVARHRSVAAAAQPLSPFVRAWLK